MAARLRDAFYAFPLSEARLQARTVLLILLGLLVSFTPVPVRRVKILH